MKETSFIDTLLKHLENQRPEPVFVETLSEAKMREERNLTWLLTQVSRPTRAKTGFYEHRPRTRPTETRSAHREPVAAAAQPEVSRALTLSALSLMILNKWKRLGAPLTDADFQAMTEEKMKRAYRTLAKTYHPDRQTDAQRTPLFYEIAEEYSLLCEEMKAAA